MRRPLSLAAKVSGAALVCALVYRGVRLYFKNDITVYVTEVVHLPTTAVQQQQQQRQRRRQPQPQQTPGFSVSIEGTVEVETCVMNSYRFLLKLAGHVRSSLVDTGRAATTKSPSSSRNRVLSMQASNASVDDASFISCNHNNNSSSSGRRGGPSLLITAVDPIVDAYETDATGALAFTPACVGEGVLCRYTCVASSGVSGDAADGSGSRSDSSAASPVPSTPLPSGPTGIGNVYVCSCFLESDGETAYCQRLTVEVEFIRPVFGARVVVRLPSRHCRLQRSNAGGVGSVAQLLHQPRKCVWDIGTVSEDMCAVWGGGSGASTAVDDGDLVDSAMPGATVPPSASSAVKSRARLELVYEQAPPGFTFGEADEAAAGSSDSSDDDDDGDSLSRFGGSNSGSGRASHPRSRLSTRARSRSGSQRRMGSVGAAAAPTTTTSRARKREERATRARERAERVSRGVRVASGDDAPTVELVFSVNQLLSGTSVKKLQVVEERPNWEPRSRLDHVVLRRVVPGLERLKLKKYAHYTTWFVQPVEVSQL
ncbi:hypothetical protein NESM_000619100 [Novymonas esmeraldas]|uniref:Uncharacterized protein n=1 Tax=Novymonas esmeraldas TaxID=1808958 RepID=A0AAW0EUP6_9TRYP